MTMRFEPKPRDILRIEDRYEIAPHPGAPGLAFAQEGRKSVVYQVRSIERGQAFALKVFKDAYRNSEINKTAQRIKQYANVPGMAVCNRIVLTRARHSTLIRQYAELEYAVLMPWVGDQNWVEVILRRVRLSADQCFALATATANVLTMLEERGLAHCDLAGANVLIDKLDVSAPSVYLVDVEDMFSPESPPLPPFPMGADGYQHRASQGARTGQWCREGDRFSGAVLLAEMLSWYDPGIVNVAYGEYYFTPKDMQDPHSDRYKLLLGVLEDVSPEIAELFRSAWSSRNLDECPRLSQWAEVLDQETQRRLAVTEWKQAIASGEDKRIVAVYERFSILLPKHVLGIVRAAQQRIAVMDAALTQLRDAFIAGDNESIWAIYTTYQDTLKSCAALGANERTRIDEAERWFRRKRLHALQKAIWLDDDSRIEEAYADCLHLSDILTRDERQRAKQAQQRMEALRKLRSALASRNDEEVVRVYAANADQIESCSALTAKERQQIRSSQAAVSAVALQEAIRTKHRAMDVVALGDAAIARGCLVDPALLGDVRHARRLKSTFERLEAAVQANDDWAILLAYDPEMLDGNGLMTPELRDRVEVARRLLPQK